jgi:DNA polymerase-3 subunit delta
MANNFIIVSDDKVAAGQKVEEISSKFNSSYERLTIDLSDEGLYALVDELNTVSLFEEPKIITVKSSDSLLNNKNEKAFNELIKSMNNIDNSNVLIFIFLDKIDYNNERFVKLRKYSSFIQVFIKNVPLDEYAKKSFEDEGYTVSSQALSLLASYTNSLESINSAINILKCYKALEKKITDNDVITMISAPLEDNVYQLVEAVLSNDKKHIFKRYQDLKIVNVMPSYIVSLLLNKFQEMYNVKILSKANVSQDSIASIFNVSSGRAYYMVKNAKSVTIENIKEKLTLLNDLDVKIKTGRIDQAIGLELFLLD